MLSFLKKEEDIGDLYQFADKLFTEDKGLHVDTRGSDLGPFKINTIRQDYSDFTEWWRSLSKTERDKAVAYVKWLAKEQGVRYRTLLK